MNWNLLDFAVMLACSAVSSAGLGGGGLLILYLIAFCSLPQLEAQGINLLFFIPCSVLSIIIYVKNKLIKPKAVLPMLTGAVVGAGMGSVIVKQINPGMLKPAFAVFLILSGVALIFGKDKNKDEDN